MTGTIAVDREDRIFSRLLFAGQIAFGVVCAFAVLASPAVRPPLIEEEPRAIQLRLDMPVASPEPEVVQEVIPELTVAERAYSEPEAEPEAELVGAESEPTPVEAEIETETPPQAPLRRVYGVRKVLANGLGERGSSAGLVTKVGNALSGVRDTLTATPTDVLGSLVSLASVDAAPEPIRRVVPEYSDELRRERASGTVSARLLVDLEGGVRRVEILSDFGWDSAALATRAFEQFRFRPARRDGRAVSVWIVHKIRFEFQE